MSLNTAQAGKQSLATSVSGSKMIFDRHAMLWQKSKAHRQHLMWRRLPTNNQIIVNKWDIETPAQPMSDYWSAFWPRTSEDSQSSISHPSVTTPRGQCRVQRSNNVFWAATCLLVKTHNKKITSSISVSLRLHTASFNRYQQPWLTQLNMRECQMLRRGSVLTLL